MKQETHSMGAFDAKTHFSQVLDRVEHGETITITRHGHTVAKIIPVEKDCPREKAVAALERMKARRSQLKGASVQDIIDMAREGHRFE